MKKRCSKCSRLKSLGEFYKHPRTADRRMAKCKECTKADVHAHRQKNLEKIRKYDRVRAKLPHRKKKQLRITREWRAVDQRRTRAQNMVARAIKNGVMTRKLCQVCGSKKSHAHHDNYDHPMDVMFLCAIHHKVRHAELKAKGLNP